ncbi:restriction endonuclease subunit S [Vreelandella gomseomensis]|uniref:Restriction endonuclease subunit S n=1 Tax=Vreelandella gomseomensis TaxID=370766 RepID=A0ABU1G7I1_9GAMM|nr:restriction endonuclease subunit S [Halomonas gomseomensis]MDR5873442.1 restriction endonuclease subunit S [Halomonas gomseomensis]
MTYPAYPEYKDSGVEWLGEVPAHWEVKRLRYVAELNPAKTEVRALPTESLVSFIPMEAVGDDGSLSLEQIRPISEVLAGYTYVSEGDVTIAKITPCFENGKGAVMRGLENRVGFGTTELTVMRPKTSLTTSDYLYRVVTSEPFRALGVSSMYGAGGQKRVPDDFVRNFTIAWPPYKEQAEIQAFLDHETARIDALVEEQQRLIELLKEKRQAVISHAVTKGLDPDVPMKDSGVEWLGEVPAHWYINRLRYVAELNPSKSEVRLLPTDSSVSFIPMEAVGEGGTLSLKQTRPIGEVLAGYTYFREGDVTIAKITPCFENGKGAVMSGLENAVGFGTTELTVIRPKSGLATSGYLYRVVSSEPFRALGESSMYGAGGQKRVPEDFVRNFNIAWPPFKEQAEIQAFLDHETARIDALLEAGQSGIKLLQERRSALISAAVTGKIDVRGWRPPADSAVATGEATQVEAV